MQNIDMSVVMIIVGSLNILFVLLMTIVVIVNNSKIKRITEKYNKFMTGLSDRNLDVLIDKIINDLSDLKDKNKAIENHLSNIDINQIQNIQKIGIVRFNAFDNVGSDLSYAVALLNANDDGVVLSGLYSRDSSASYAKPIVSGKSKYTLSAEEVEAMDLAKKNYIKREYIASTSDLTLEYNQ